MNLPASNFRVFEDNAERPIASLAVSEAPISAGIVFDASRSMRPRIQRSRTALEGFLKTSGASDEFFLVRFNDKPELAAPFTRTPADILDSLTGVEAKGWTALHDAICLAANIVRKGKHARRILIVLTDGNDNNSRYSEAELLSLLREADVQVYAIDLIERSRSLEKMCEETGGRSIWVRRMSDLPDAMEDLSRQIRSEYLVSYSPRDMQNDGRYHRVRIEVDAPAGLSKVFPSCAVATTRRESNVSPPEAEGHGNHVRRHAARVDVVVPRFREYLHMTAAQLHRESRAAIEPALILPERSDHLIRCERARIEPKPRVEEDPGLNHGLRELHGAMINAAATGHVEIHRTFLCHMEYRVEREAPSAHVAIGRLHLREKCVVDG